MKSLPPAPASAAWYWRRSAAVPGRSDLPKRLAQLVNGRCCSRGRPHPLGVAYHGGPDKVFVEEKTRVHIDGWTNRTPKLLMPHHLAIGTAGGARVQEAIAARCPTPNGLN
jgi:hypothetical protein